jgi:hypothetical protein
MANKKTTGNPVKDGKRGPGRPKGVRNKTTQAAKSMIEEAAERLGGVNRMVKWVKEAPENERAFWATIYPKLLPLQVSGSGENGEHMHKVLVEYVAANNS